MSEAISMEYLMEELDPKIKLLEYTHADTRRDFSYLKEDIFVYEYTHTKEGWILCIGTCGKIGSGELSLGGFRIIPEYRASNPDFSPRKEASELSDGMHEKVYWSKKLKIAGPKGKPYLDRIVGGKCVLLPTLGSRIGEAKDYKILEFAAKCLKHFEDTTGIYITTGQDLGHGLMHDGKTTSLDFLHTHFFGSIRSDTSKPTGEGNFFALKGISEACSIPLSKAHIGLVGCGNVGEQVLLRLLEHGAKVSVVEANPTKRDKLKAMDIEVLSQDEKFELFKRPLDAVCVNAAIGSLDRAAIDQIIKNPSIRFTCGSENLSMPDEDSEGRLLAASKFHAPTEYCGMLGYLTAVEEYLALKDNATFVLSSLFAAARELEIPSKKAAEKIINSNYKLSFSEALNSI